MLITKVCAQKLCERRDLFLQFAVLKSMFRAILVKLETDLVDTCCCPKMQHQLVNKVILQSS